jgi:hypothetical protein
MSRIFVATYFFVLPFRNAKFCSVPNKPLLKLGARWLKKVAEHCHRVSMEILFTYY